MVHDYPSVNRELKAYEILSKEATLNPSIGIKYIRQALDHFQIRHGEYDYHFLVHEPLGLNMEILLDQNGQGFQLWMVRDIASKMLHALKLLHNANVIHTRYDGLQNSAFSLIQL